jgi:hypothetical protein
MQLGASYNAFDGIELITGSIASIRDDVDHISVITQDQSNYGVPFDQDDMDLLMDLRRNKVIDELFQVSAQPTRDPHITEIRKRQVGYDTAKKAGCTHYISMDVDEYWEHLGLVSKYVEDEDYDGTYCRYINYYGDKNHQMPLTSMAYVPAIYKIAPNKAFTFGNSLTQKVICDPTRQMPCNHVGFIDDVVMHHMSYIRKDEQAFRSKLENSSAKRNWVPAVTDMMVSYYATWVPGMDGKIISGKHGTGVVKLTEVENDFE